jgi:signal transduction histidine kinase
MTRRSRLALSYLSIIMAVSLLFSTALYRVAVGEADRGLRRQVNSLRDNIYFVRPEVIAKQRTAELDQYRHRILTRLVYVNLGMLGLGAFLSFYLARRNLEPLEQALDSQARFTSDAAHELRTPLTAMRTETEVGLRDTKLKTSEAKALLRSNLEEVAKLETLTNALLRLAKNGLAPDTSAWKPVNVRQLVDTAVSRVKVQAESADMTFDTEAVANLTVRGDADQLAEALVVLLDNAIKYGTPGSAVTLAAADKGTNVELSVTNKGVGIKQSDLPHIFERFYRADQSRNKTLVPGYGLGLSLADAIVKSHRGSIRAASTAGKSATFSIVLPKNS